MRNPLVLGIYLFTRVVELGSFTANADWLLNMAIGGIGIIRLGDFLGAQALENKLLTALFPQNHDGDPKPLPALILPGCQYIFRVRAFIDFLKLVVQCNRVIAA